MFSMKKIAMLPVLIALLTTGGFAVYSQVNGGNVNPSDFDPNEPNEIPDPSIIDIDIIGIAQIGQVFMIEGIDNETSVVFSGSRAEAGNTTYARLVLHGVFDQQIRRWREEVIAGTITLRDIDIELRSSNNRRAVTIEFEDCVPTRFSIPPLSLDGSTRYMERLELVYRRFTITN